MSGPYGQGYFSLSQLVARAATINPNGIATIFRGQMRTWAEHRSRVAAFAGALKAAGLGPGERVGVLAANSDRYVEVVYGIIWAGGIAVPLNTRLSPVEVSDNLKDAGVRYLIVDESTHGLARDATILSGLAITLIDLGDRDESQGCLNYGKMIQESDDCDPAEVDGSSIAAIVYSGGTTGRSKGIVIGQAGIIINAFQSIDELQIELETRWLHSVPMFHIAGIGHTVAILVKAATHVITPRFDPADTLALIEHCRCSHLALVPTMIAMLVEAARVKNSGDYSSIRYIQYGGAPMPESLLVSALSVWKDVRFVQFFGQTESGPIMTALPPCYHKVGNPKLRSVGRPVPIYAIQIWDENGNRLEPGQVGEIVGRSPSAMLGYWNRPELTQEVFKGGWLHTGDAGYLDTDGFLYVSDRLKDVIISGGENVYSAEVEHALYAHPDVEQCAVIGIADILWGERVHAYVKLRDGADADADSLTEHCRSLIARYKAPRSYTISRDALPLSPAGKILKTELRKLSVPPPKTGDKPPP